MVDVRGSTEPTAALTAVVEDLAGELSLRPLLERILLRSTELLGCDAGSICLVDEAAGVYRKEADIGIGCQSGMVFPLNEGVTGAIVARRGPVIFDDYAKVPGGHVRPEDRAALKGVIGVPIWWRGSIVGACVVFSRDAARSFVPADADLLEVFAKHAAIAITNARLHEAAEANARAEAVAAERNRMAREVHDAVAQGLVSILLQLRSAEGALASGDVEDASDALGQARAAAEAAFEETRRSVLGLAPSPLEGRSLEEALKLELAWANRTGVVDARLVTSGTRIALPPNLAHTLFRIAQEALTNALRHARARSVRVGIVYGDAGVTVLVQDDGDGFDRAAVEHDGRDGLDGMAERARSARRHVRARLHARLGDARARVDPDAERDRRRTRARATAARARRRRSRRDAHRHRPPPRVGGPEPPDRGGGRLGARRGRRLARAPARRRAHGPQDARRRRRRGDRHDPRGGPERHGRRRERVRERRVGGGGPARRRARLRRQGRLAGGAGGARSRRRRGARPCSRAWPPSASRPT